MSKSRVGSLGRRPSSWPALQSLIGLHALPRRGESPRAQSRSGQLAHGILARLACNAIDRRPRTPNSVTCVPKCSEVPQCIEPTRSPQTL
jgi:hypothetical protein